MTHHKIAPAVLMPLALGLAACESEAETPAADEPAQAASGEVLGGTISDDMIDYEQLQSRAPTIAEEPDSDAGSSAQSSDSSE